MIWKILVYSSSVYRFIGYIVVSYYFCWKIMLMKKFIFVCSFISLFFSSCVSIKHGSHPGVGRIRSYEFVHSEVPDSFDGFRIAFISDLHYKSKFTEQRLSGLVRTLRKLAPDMLLLGGDYQEGCEFVRPLVEKLALVKPPYGVYGVMGNNDYERCYQEILTVMEQHGIHIIEHHTDTVVRGGQRILVAGVRNPFDLKRNGRSPTLDLSADDFVILLTHTPDYIEDVAVTNTDLALAGHTHGGQVTLFGFAPQTASHYGRRFRTGLKKNSEGIPVIVTNGVGTSRRNVRLMAPSEVVLITLRRKYSD